MSSIAKLAENFTDIPSALLVLSWLGVLRWARRSGWLIAPLSLVGTTLHEALHWGAGWLLQARPTSFSILPRREGNRWVLGSVGFTNLNIWNSAPVALAPLLLAVIAIAVFQFWTSPAIQAHEYVSWVLSGYVVATSLASSIPSSTDLKVGAVSCLMYSGIGYGLWLLTR